MALLKLKQLRSSLSYNETTNTLFLSGSSDPSFVISGSLFVTGSGPVTGSITIAGIDNFGDSGSFDTLDLGDY